MSKKNNTEEIKEEPKKPGRKKKTNGKCIMKVNVKHDGVLYEKDSEFKGSSEIKKIFEEKQFI